MTDPFHTPDEERRRRQLPWEFEALARQRRREIGFVAAAVLMLLAIATIIFLAR